MLPEAERVLQAIARHTFLEIYISNLKYHKRFSWRGCKEGYCTGAQSLSFYIDMWFTKVLNLNF